MRNDNEVIAQRLAQWMDSLSQFDLPDWDSLPQLDLYMDQVILLLRRYLTPLDPGGDERSITASIINNYVRMKVMPPPVKKRYSRVHLAYLIIICTLKQSLSISCIQRMLPEDHGEEAARALYEAFVLQYRSSIRRMEARRPPGRCTRPSCGSTGPPSGFCARCPSRGRAWRSGGTPACRWGAGTAWSPLPPSSPPSPSPSRSTCSRRMPVMRRIWRTNNA